MVIKPLNYIMLLCSKANELNDAIRHSNKASELHDAIRHGNKASELQREKDMGDQNDFV